MTNKPKPEFWYRLFPAQYHGSDGVVAYGYIQVPFEIKNDVLCMAMPVDQLREVISAHDKAKSHDAHEAAEAVFQTANKNTKNEGE